MCTVYDVVRELLVVAADIRYMLVCRRSVSVVDFAFFLASGMLAAHHRVVIRHFVKKKNIPKKRMCLKPLSPEFSEDRDDGYHKM